MNRLSFFFFFFLFRLFACFEYGYVQLASFGNEGRFSEKLFGKVRVNRMARKKVARGWISWFGHYAMRKKWRNFSERNCLATLWEIKFSRDIQILGFQAARRDWSLTMWQIVSKWFIYVLAKLRDLDKNLSFQNPLRIWTYSFFPATRYNEKKEGKKNVHSCMKKEDSYQLLTTRYHSR